MNIANRRRNTVVSLFAVLLMLTVLVAPVLSESSDGSTVAGSYDVYLQKGQTWKTSISYTASLSPNTSVKVATTESDATSSSGWSAATSDSTTVTSGDSSSTAVVAGASIVTSSHSVSVEIEVGSGYSGTTAYVGVKISTVNPSQSAVTVFKVHVLDMKFTTTYSGGSFYMGQTISTQTPAVTTGNSDAKAKTVTYTISTGSNESKLTANTGLSFNTSTGAISGTVSKVTNSSVTYTVVATMTFASGYPAAQTMSTSFTIGTYSSASASDVAAYAITGETNVNVAKPTTSGLTYSVSSATYSVNGGNSNSVSVGKSINGLTVASNGSITGTPTACGVYTIKENLKVSETGQTTSRTVTITVEDRITVKTDSATVNRYTGNATAGNVLATASQTETNTVTGTWSISSGNNAGYFTIGTDGTISVKKTPAAGTYVLGIKYTSAANSTNSGTTTLTVNVDPALTLKCSDADSVLYAATTSTFLDDGQDKATMSQTSTLYAESKTVSYKLSCSDGSSILNYVTITKAGVVSISDSIDSTCVGSHTITVTCTDDAVQSNTATAAITVTVVSGMSLEKPTVGEISSH